MEWSSQKVMITGHTGFKGAWLTQWLVDLGASVLGYALKPNTSPALFEQLELNQSIEHHIGDICDYAALRNVIKNFKPDIIFHLAAQPLVRRSYRDPVETWNSNVQGTLHLLEAVRDVNHPCSIIAITTDKVYENSETGKAFQETDPLGGYDPYSASKAACEILINGYRQSFFQDNHIKLASARAGNVVGGGDYSEDRILPDIIRAISAGNPVELRNPQAVRPWQHVLDPLAGYMKLAEQLVGSGKCQSAYNFGPDLKDIRSVKEIVEAALDIWPGHWIDRSKPGQLHEANLLSLSIKKAQKELNWSPVWNFETAVNKTISWYKAVHDGAGVRDITRSQIVEFMR